MTAGSGVVHAEMPSDDVMKNGGRSEGFQLWVNLPAKDKMIPPRYQDTAAELIPIVTDQDGKVWVKVIAGESLGTSYLHLLFFNRNSKINAYVNSNMKNVTESLKGNQLLKTFCIVHYLCFSIM